MSRMPQQRPGKSIQTVRTPTVFLDSLRRKLGIKDFDIDLAADINNRVCPLFYDEEMDSLSKGWKVGDGWNFCNPPYSDITPWVKKALYESEEKGAKTAMLLPASPGSNWWYYYVHEMGYVIFLNGRPTFVGHTSPYPKDLAVVLYAPVFEFNGGYSVWSWRD